MKSNKLFCLLFLLLFMNSRQVSAQMDSLTVYLIPGQGADYRLYNHIELDSVYKVKYIHYFTPDHAYSMNQYARELAKQIDTTEDFALVGVSFGGMLATEMSTFISPKNVIIVSSAQNRNELPFRYRFQNKIPIYRIFPPKMLKFGAQLMQPLIEPDRNNEKETFKSMLKSKDPYFFKPSIAMIVSWDRVIYSEDIIHIHGDKDKTIPLRNVSADKVVKNGSHMMTLTRGDEISILINMLLKI